MFLATGPSFEFIKLFQVLSWIILSIGLPAVLLTVFFHYRKKKLALKNETETEDLIQASPELLGYTKGDGEYIFFDHSSLISEFKKKLTYNHARYTALCRDFEKLEIRYAELADYTIARHGENDNSELIPGYGKLSRSLQKEITKFAAKHKEEKQQLFSRMEQLSRSYDQLEAESQALQDQLKFHTANEDERRTILDRWTSENAMLRGKLNEQQYVHELLVQQKVQLQFLQEQLEQKIKDNNQLDQAKVMAIATLDEERNRQSELLQRVDELKSELLQKQEEADKLQSVVCSKEEQLAAKQAQVKTKDDHISWLENSWNESKNTNAELQQLLYEHKSNISSLQQQLLDEQAKTLGLQQSLQEKEQAVQQLYGSLVSVAVKDEAPLNDASPVVKENWNDDSIVVH